LIPLEATKKTITSQITIPATSTAEEVTQMQVLSLNLQLAAVKNILPSFKTHSAYKTQRWRVSNKTKIMDVSGLNQLKSNIKTNDPKLF